MRVDAKKREVLASFFAKVVLQPHQFRHFLLRKIYMILYLEAPYQFSLSMKKKKLSVEEGEP